MLFLSLLLSVCSETGAYQSDKKYVLKKQFYVATAHSIFWEQVFFTSKAVCNTQNNKWHPPEK